MTIEELRAKLVALKTEITDLAAKEAPDEAELTRFDAAIVEFEELKPQLDALETRARKVDQIRQSATNWADGHDVPAQINRRDPFDGEVRGAPYGELRDRALIVLESRAKGHLTERQAVHVERLLRGRNGGGEAGGGVVAQRLLVTESEEYHSAFQKGMRAFAGGPPAMFTPDEARAIEEFQRVDSLNTFIASEQRAANEGTPASGGYGIPVLIDPTIILTSGAAQAPLLEISRIITITTNQWKGVNSAGFTWAFGAEGAVVADNTPVLAQPTIPVYRASGFIPYTVEVEQDYPGFEEEMGRLLEQGYLNLLALKTQQGSGTSEPWGIFSRMIATTTGPAHIVVTTLGTVGAADVRKAWGSLPERFRPTATYDMSVQAENDIRASGNNLALSDYTVNMAANGVGILTGRPIVLSDYAAPWTGTTGNASAVVVGDFQHFAIVQRAGMSVEMVPHLFDTSTGRPLGERGWFAWARLGHDVTTTNAFRLISNTTAAY